MNIHLMRLVVEHTKSRADELPRQFNVLGILRRRQFPPVSASKLFPGCAPIHSGQSAVALGNIGVMQNAMNQFVLRQINRKWRVHFLAENALRTLGDEHAVALFAAPQIFFGPLTLGDVHHGIYELHHVPGRVQNRMARGVSVFHRAIGKNNSVIHFVI